MSLQPICAWVFHVIWELGHRSGFCCSRYAVSRKIWIWWNRIARRKSGRWKPSSGWFLFVGQKNLILSIMKWAATLSYNVLNFVRYWISLNLTLLLALYWMHMTHFYETQKWRIVPFLISVLCIVVHVSSWHFHGQEYQLMGLLT